MKTMIFLVAVAYTVMLISEAAPAAANTFIQLSSYAAQGGQQ